ncbi:MAG: hypothetical protein ABJH63_08830 [Rhizobiaceae bacterium]
MSATSDYKTTKNGMIDYQHYIHKSHEIRSQDAWRNIRAISKALKAVVGIFRRTFLKKPVSLPRESESRPVRTPPMKNARLAYAQSEAEGVNGQIKIGSRIGLTV